MSPEERMVRRRLAWFRHVEEITRNVAMRRRYYGVSRNTYYIWHRRYCELGAKGQRDRSRQPHSHPGTTPREVAEKILCLRRYYHFGQARIRMYLHRYHAISLSQTSIWRILRRAGVSRLPSNMRHRGDGERYRRYEKPLPGHQLQIDDCTRVQALRIYDRNTQQTAIAFVDYGLARLPFRVQCIQTDNESEFGSQFHWHVLDKGIQHRYIRSRRPYLNGKGEQS